MFVCVVALSLVVAVSLCVGGGGGGVTKLKIYRHNYFILLNFG